LFDVFITEKFEEQFKKLTKKDATLKKRLSEKIAEMKKEKPSSQVGIVADFRGKCKMRMERYRLLYAYCQDCREYKHQAYNKCVGCETKDNNALVFFEVFHRSKDYRNF